MTETTNLPTTLSYTADDVSRDVQRKLLREGWYALLCVGNVPAEAKTGSLRFEQTFVPLKDPTDGESKGNMKIRDYLSLPFENPEKKGHKIPNTVRVVHSRLKALGGEIGDDIPDYPRKEDGAYAFKGEEITKEELQDCDKEVSEAVRKRIIELWEEPTKVHGYVMFGYVKVNGDYNNIATSRAQLPDGEELVPVEQWFNHD